MSLYIKDFMISLKPIKEWCLCLLTEFFGLYVLWMKQNTTENKFMQFFFRLYAGLQMFREKYRSRCRTGSGTHDYPSFITTSLFFCCFMDPTLKVAYRPAPGNTQKKRAQKLNEYVIICMNVSSPLRKWDKSSAMCAGIEVHATVRKTKEEICIRHHTIGSKSRWIRFGGTCWCWFRPNRRQRRSSSFRHAVHIILWNKIRNKNDICLRSHPFLVPKAIGVFQVRNTHTTNTLRLRTETKMQRQR